jgi:hypothetical protein
MDYKARCITAIVAVTGCAATLFIAGCSVEMPKSALPAFRLSPPVEVSSPPNPDTSKPTETRAP